MLDCALSEPFFTVLGFYIATNISAIVGFKKYSPSIGTKDKPELFYVSMVLNVCHLYCL